MSTGAGLAPEVAVGAAPAGVVVVVASDAECLDVVEDIEIGGVLDKLVRLLSGTRDVEFPGNVEILVLLNDPLNAACEDAIMSTTALAYFVTVLKPEA